jgi:spore germination protein
MMKKNAIAVTFLTIFSLIGCAEPQILEDIGLITTIGYDLGEKGLINGTAVELKIEPDAKTDVKIVEEQAYSVRGLNTSANKKTSKKLLAGQLRVILLGEELGKQGMIHVLETLTKDPTVSDLSYLSIVDGETRDLLKLKDPHIPNIGIHLYRLLDKNTNDEHMPLATLQEVLNRYYTVGKDPFMPVLKKIDNKEVSYTGVGIFKEDRLVGRISTNQSFYLKLINDKYKAGSKDLMFMSESSKLRGISHTEGKTVISLDTIDSRSDIKLVNEKKLEFDIKVKLNARLIDINSDIDLTQSDNLKLFEKEVSKEMKKRVEELISYCQSKNSDVIGLGEVYRSTVRHSELTKEKWHKMYKNAKVNVDVDFIMMRAGTND